MLQHLAHCSPWLLLPLFAIVCYFQNMAFTASSRTRNSGDTKLHRKAAWASNGVYILTHSTFLYLLYRTFTSGNYPLMVITAVVYTLSTTEGSVRMMKLMLDKTTGKAKLVTEEDLKKVHARIDAVLNEMMQTMIKRKEEVISGLGTAKQDLSRVTTPITELEAKL